MLAENGCVGQTNSYSNNYEICQYPGKCFKFFFEFVIKQGFISMFFFFKRLNNKNTHIILDTLKSRKFWLFEMNLYFFQYTRLMGDSTPYFPIILLFSGFYKETMKLQQNWNITICYSIKLFFFLFTYTQCLILRNTMSL